MNLLKRLRKYMDNDPRLKPYLLMWLRKTTKTINEWPQEKLIKGVMDCYDRRMGYLLIYEPLSYLPKNYNGTKSFMNVKNLGI